MAELFAHDHPIQSDQTTPPIVSTTELKNAMALVYNHVTFHRQVDRETLEKALDKLAICANNENWCIYVP